jgi:7-cyano-7-deazaguanine synthase in queuosine biosynthesis
MSRIIKHLLSVLSVMLAVNVLRKMSNYSTGTYFSFYPLIQIEVIDANQNFWNRYIDTQVAQVISVDPTSIETCNQRQAPGRLNHVIFFTLTHNMYFSAGFVCMDCRVLARCVFRNNGWDTIPLEACDEGQNLYCNANEQRCSPNLGPCHPGGGGGSGSGNFACTSPGVL